MKRMNEILIYIIPADDKVDSSIIAIFENTNIFPAKEGHKLSYDLLQGYGNIAINSISNFIKVKSCKELSEELKEELSLIVNELQKAYEHGLYIKKGIVRLNAEGSYEVC